MENLGLDISFVFSSNINDMNSFYRDKKVLITGHTGFKGAWLAKILANSGASIVGVSLPPNTKPNLYSILGVENLLAKNYFCDIRDTDALKKIFKHERPEIVFHLAAQPLVRDSYDDPIFTHTTNIIGTANIMQAAKEAGCVKSMVIITTDKVYENKESLAPYSETDPLGGYDPYSASKAAADIVANSYIQSFFNPRDYGATHHTLVAIARAGNVIGGGDWAKDRLLVDMVRAIFEKDESMIMRSPGSIRPWQHVFEPLRGYMMLAEKLYSGDKEVCGAWNFGPDSDSFVSVEEVVKRGLSIFGKGEYKIIEDKDKHEANLLKLNIEKAKSSLGWVPRWDLDECLRKTFEWYEKFYAKAGGVAELSNKHISFYFDE